MRSSSKKITISLLFIALILSISFYPQPGKAEDFGSGFSLTATGQGKTGGGGFWKILSGGLDLISNPAGFAAKHFPELPGAQGFFNSIKRGAITALGGALRENLINKYLNKLLAKIQDQVITDYDDIDKNAANDAIERFGQEVLGTDFCNPQVAQVALKVIQSQPQLYNTKSASCDPWEKIANIENIWKNPDGTNKGWNDFIRLSTPKQNPYSYYFLTLQAKSDTTATALNRAKNKNVTGLGFFGDERVYKWHFVDKNNIPVGGISCPTKEKSGIATFCAATSDGTVCDCPSGLSLKNFTNWKNNPDPNSTYLPKNCIKITDINDVKGVYDAYTLLCRLVIDEQKTVTPGSVFGNLAARALYSDVDRAQSSGDDFLQDVITRIVDSTVYRLTDKGLSALGFKKDGEEEGGVDFSLSRRRSRSAENEKTAFEILKTVYEETIENLEEKLGMEDEIITILSPGPAGRKGKEERKALSEKLQTAIGCAQDRCMGQELNYCREISGIALNPRRLSNEEIGGYEQDKKSGKIEGKLINPRDPTVPGQICYNNEKAAYLNECENLFIETRGDRTVNLCEKEKQKIEQGFIRGKEDPETNWCLQLEQCQQVQAHNLAKAVCSPGPLQLCQGESAQFCGVIMEYGKKFTRLNLNEIEPIERHLPGLNKELTGFAKEKQKVDSYLALFADDQLIKNLSIGTPALLAKDKLIKELEFGAIKPPKTFNDQEFAENAKVYEDGSQTGKDVFRLLNELGKKIKWANLYLMCLVSKQTNFNNCSFLEQEIINSETITGDVNALTWANTAKENQNNPDYWNKQIQIYSPEREQILKKEILVFGKPQIKKALTSLRNLYGQNLKIIINDEDQQYNGLEELARSLENKRDLLLAIETDDQGDKTKEDNIIKDLKTEISALEKVAEVWSLALSQLMNEALIISDTSETKPKLDEALKYHDKDYLNKRKDEIDEMDVCNFTPL